MKRHTQTGWPALTLGLALLTSLLSAADPVNRAEPDWWLTPRRMIQTNLREIDAAMDVEAYVTSLKAAGANVVLFNVGGIVANYPTDLPYHHRNPFMKGDLTCTVPVLNAYDMVLFDIENHLMKLNPTRHGLSHSAANDWPANKIEHTFVSSEREYDDFILELDLKDYPGFNSRILLRCVETPADAKVRLNGYQV
jgi:hypothetical protein